jgi:hypothetical protein
MQFQVPQFIETEDKIVGPFTLKQFAFVGVGVLLSMMLYFTVETWLWVIGSIIIFAIALGLAFVKIEGRPFINVILSAVGFYWKPQTYVWQPEHPTVNLPKKVEMKPIAVKPAPKKEVVAKHTTGNQSPFFQFTPKPIVKKPAESQPIAKPEPVSRETVSTGSALHKIWENLQTGASLVSKTSDKQFLEKKMEERYQIFRRAAGDRQGAKRVDYR